MRISDCSSDVCSSDLSAYQHDNDNGYISGLIDDRGFERPSGDSGFGGISRNIDFAIGSSFADGAGHAMAYATWRKNDALFQGDRDYKIGRASWWERG